VYLFIIMNLSINYYPTYLAATQAGNISTLAASSAKTALDATEQFWTKMYNGSGIFGELSKFCMPLAFLFIVWKVYQLFEEYREQPDYTKIMSSLTLPLIVIFMLHNSGAMAKGFTRGLRTISANFGIEMIGRSGNDAFLDSTKANMPPAMKSSQIFKDLTKDLDKCRVDSQPGVCGNLAGSKMIRELNAMNPPADPVTKAYATDLMKQLTAKMQAANGAANAGINWDSVMGIFSKGLPSFGDIGEQIVITLLNAVVVGFYWSLELATLLAFYLFPIALTIGVMDKKAIVDWFTSFWGISNAKICFAIVLALIGQVGTAMEGASFVIELLGAIFAPILAFMMAKGSALALAEGFQGAVTGGVVGIGRGAGGVAQRRIDVFNAGRSRKKQAEANAKAMKGQS
jgi:hypothetical protein